MTWTKTDPGPTTPLVPLPPVRDERAILPYDPMITLTKTMKEAGLSAGVLLATALVGWMVESENFTFIVETIGIGGMSGLLLIPVLHGLLKGALNWLKTRKGVPYERRADGIN